MKFVQRKIASMAIDKANKETDMGKIKEFDDVSVSTVRLIEEDLGDEFLNTDYKSNSEYAERNQQLGSRPQRKSKKSILLIAANQAFLHSQPTARRIKDIRCL